MTSDRDTKKLALAGITAALSFAGYAVFPAVNAFGLKFHLGNAFVVLGALLLGGVPGGLAGAVGLSIADIISGFAAAAPITFVCKFLIGLITGLVAHRSARLSESHPKKYILKWSVLASAAGLGCNCLADPVLNYLWQRLITPGAEALLSINILFTVLNAAVNTVCAVALYSALRPVLRRMNLL